MENPAEAGPAEPPGLLSAPHPCLPPSPWKEQLWPGLPGLPWSVGRGLGWHLGQNCPLPPRRTTQKQHSLCCALQSVGPSLNTEQKG